MGIRVTMSCRIALPLRWCFWFLVHTVMARKFRYWFCSSRSYFRRRSKFCSSADFRQAGFFFGRFSASSYFSAKTANSAAEGSMKDGEKIAIIPKGNFTPTLFVSGQLRNTTSRSLVLMTSSYRRNNIKDVITVESPLCRYGRFVFHVGYILTETIWTL